MGDWNADMPDPSNTDSHYMSNIMGKLSLQLIDTGPTHHTGNTHTWIDLLLIDQCDTILDSGRKSSPFRDNRVLLAIRTY